MFQTNSLFDSIVVNSISFHDNAFAVSNTGFMLGPMAQHEIEVAFHPLTIGMHDDTLQIETTRGNLTIRVSGELNE